MGKKSRAKKERREEQAKELPLEQKTLSYRRSSFERFLSTIVHFGTYLTLFTPLIVSSKFYFPFVGPKSLYLMAGCEIVFFAWLLLAIYYKQYRPRINHILTALVLFLIILILSSVLGVDFSRSFWSKYERMTGLLMWLHLFGFFLAVSSTFRKVSDWKRVFLVSVSVSILLAFFSIPERAGVEALRFSGRGGSTLGNTSFLGTYLLFNVFLALYLFWQEKKKFLKVFLASCVLLNAFAIYYAGARAATVATVGGFGLIFLLFLSFWPKRRELRIIGKTVLVIFALIVVMATVLLFLPDNPVHNKFVALTTRSRPVNWEMAQKGFLEKPLLGWGPENYTVLFPKFFNPCLFTGRCGGEIWFDRTHNIVWDTLATTGVFGFLTYLGLFGALFYVLGKKYLKEKSINFWTFSIFTVLPVAYFIQNLTVFDMPVSLMLFVLILGFGAFLTTKERPRKVERKFVLKHRWLGVLLLFVFGFTFFEFVIQPLRTDAFVIKSLQAQTSEERVKFYKKTLEASPLGKYQIRDFFGQHSMGIIRQNIQTMPKEEAKKELDFVIEELGKTRQESPLDFRSILKLVQVHNVYALLDASKVALAEQYGEEAKRLSPTNQQAYWALAQTKIYQGDVETALSLAQQAIDLEPSWLQSHKIAVQIAGLYSDKEKAEEIIQQAIALNPDWAGEFEGIVEKEVDPVK